MKWLLCLFLTSCAVPSKTEAFCLPKRITPMLGAIFLLAFAATFSRAEEKVPIPGLVCKEELGQCLIPIDVLNAMIDMHNRQVEKIREMEKQGPRCAKVELVPEKKK